MSATGIWYVQVGALVLGHVPALVLAHDRALELYGGPRDATRSQIVMLILMVAFTCLGLWLLSAALNMTSSPTPATGAVELLYLVPRARDGRGAAERPPARAPRGRARIATSAHD